MQLLRSTIVFYLILLGALVPALGFAVPAEKTAEGTNSTGGPTFVEESWAIWKDIDTRFWFSSFDTFYNCDALANKFELLLVHYGARNDVKVTAGGCHGSSGIDNIISVRARFAVPQIIDQANQSPDENSNRKPFKVALIEKRIKDIRHRVIGGNECMLVEHFRDHLLKEFDHEITQDIRTCFSGLQNTGVRNLSAITPSLLTAGVE